MKRTFDHIGSEKDIELHIYDNIKEIAEGCFWGDVIRMEKQFILPNTTSRPIADLVLWHSDGTGTVIEVKKYKSDLWQMAAIGQVLMYGQLIYANLNEYPRMVIASDYISPLLKSTVKAYKLPIKLLEVDGDKVTLI